MSRAPYDRRLAGRAPGRTVRFPDGVVPVDPEPEPVNRRSRRRAWQLVVLAVFVAETLLLTANAVWWQLNGPWFLTAVLLGNFVVAAVLTAWMKDK